MRGLWSSLSAVGADLDPAKGSGVFTYCQAMSVSKAYIKPAYLNEEKPYSRENINSLKCITNSNEKKNPQKWGCVRVCMFTLMQMFCLFPIKTLNVDIF